VIEAYHSAMSTLRQEHPLLAMALIDHRSGRGLPMSFGTMPYLAPLYAIFEDMDGADIISAVQTGKSELFIALMLRLAGWKGRVCGYCLPTYAVRGRFVRKRIDPMLNENPAYRRRLPGEDEGALRQSGAATGSQSLKRFGRGALMFLGANTPSDFLEFSCDAFFVDEYDQCDPVNLAKARDRLRASPYPQLFRLGNPTYPKMGIDSVFQRSDGRRWHYRCSHCGEAQPLDWFVNFIRKEDDGRWALRDRERQTPPPGAGATPLGAGGGVVKGDARPLCRRCEQPFERAECWWAWVAERSMVLRHGYRMTRLDVLSQSIHELFAEWILAQGDSVALATFYTSNLGTAFEQAGARVSVEDLRTSAQADENDYVGGPSYEDDLVVMGVDVGSLLNVNIDRIRLATRPADEDDEEDVGPVTMREGVFVGTVVRFEELDDLIERFHVDVCVIDAQPEARKAQEIRDRWWGSDCDVWLCRFHPTDRIGRDRFGRRLNWKTRVVTVDRTQLLDSTLDEIRFDRRTFPSDSFSVLGWSDQMRAPVRVLDEKKGRVIWTEGSAADHFRFSDAYAAVAAMLAQSGGSYDAS